MLVRHLPAYPAMIADFERWFDPAVLPALCRHADAHGWAREPGWHSGDSKAHPPAGTPTDGPADPAVARTLAALEAGAEPDAALVQTLFSARGSDVERVCAAADALRRKVSGEAVSYVVNRHINHTSICAYACGFCAFSKGRGHAALRGLPYDPDHAKRACRVAEAAARAGPSWREVRLMHAVARLVLHVRNIEVSLTKLGPHGAAACLNGGANGLGDVLMNESISRAARSGRGEEFAAEAIEALVTRLGRKPRPRLTSYADAASATIALAKAAPPLAPVVQTKPTKIRKKELQA